MGGEPGEKGVGAERARQGLDHRRDIFAAGGKSVDVNERERRLAAGGRVAPNDGLALLRLHVGVLRFTPRQIEIEVGNVFDHVSDGGWLRRERK